MQRRITHVSSCIITTLIHFLVFCTRPWSPDCLILVLKLADDSSTAT